MTQVIIGSLIPAAAQSSEETEPVVELSTNLDDVTGEHLGPRHRRTGGRCAWRVGDTHCYGDRPAYPLCPVSPKPSH